jgi:hypothetical protein
MISGDRLPEPTFVDDLRFAAATWQRFPWLPVVSVGLSVASTVFTRDEGPFVALGIAAGIIDAGWIGTERICYLRSARGRGIDRRELTRFTIAFFVRFLVLGILLALVLIPLFIRFWPDRPVRDAAPTFGQGFVFATSVVSFVGYVLLTFVTPALAFTTRRVRSALKLGLEMIRTEWPRCLPYVAIPPLVLVVGTRLISGTGQDPSLVVASSAVGALAGLWFKGAITAFYLRRHWTGDDGAAFIDAPTSAPIAGDVPTRPDL